MSLCGFAIPEIQVEEVIVDRENDPVESQQTEGLPSREQFMDPANTHLMPLSDPLCCELA